MKKIVSVAAVAVLATVLASGRAQAATFSETGDAGETLSTAQVIRAGAQPLESISGTLSGDADLFKIFLTGGQTFSATTISSDSFPTPVDDQVLADPQLFLFDSSGKGVSANDDTSFSSQSVLSSGALSPVKSGFYYLAISSFNYDPISTGGNIFPAQIKYGEWGPTGPGGRSPLTSFTGTNASTGRYKISLTGVQAVPEPTAVLGVLALGAWGAVASWNRKVNSNKQALQGAKR